MCGIAGLIGSVPPERPVLDALRHRGPDDEGTARVRAGGHDVWLGHTRLSILDLSAAGHEPMQSRDGRWWLVYNGEIYNHLELRRELDGPFHGHSDTETLVEAIAAWGVERTLPRLNGMYAFAALDAHEGRLHLARDPFGIKPLYSAAMADGFAFASEVRALRLLVDGDAPVDPDALDLFLTLRYVPSPRTLWRGIDRLPPGHVLTYDIGSRQSELTRFIEPNTDRFAGSLDDATRAYHDVLGAAVRRQLLSDVPVGVLLSGGVDSALVAALARDAGQALRTFTVGFAGDAPECEIDDAAETARVLGLAHDAVRVTPDDLLRVLPDAVDAVEEPLGTTSILPMWHLVRRAREDVTVVLTGQGSDEPWGGYRRYQMEVWRAACPPVAALASAAGGLRAAWRGMPEAAERTLRSLPVRDTAARFVEAAALFDAGQRRRLTGRDGDGGARDATASWLQALAPRDGAAEGMMRVDTRMNLADDLLLYGDKISMAVSLEARVPMLDLEVIQFVESLPLRYRVALGRTKIVHKRMAETFLPTEIVQRKKKGFLVPFGAWSRGPWRPWIEGVLFDPSAPHLRHLREDAVRELWRDHLAGRPDRSRQMFALLTLALWWNREEGRPCAPPSP